MFVPFKIAGHLFKTRPEWTAYVRKTPTRVRGKLLDGLRREPGRGVPNFTWRGRGKTLIEWARAKNASYTIHREVAYP